MPPNITIVKPDITDEERQKRINEINDVITEIAHKYCCVQSDERKIAQ
jgi:hypothetical protein